MTPMGAAGMSWRSPSSKGSKGTGSSHDSGSNVSNTQAAGGIKAPEGTVAIVFSDITRAASLWEFNPVAMRDATILHNECLRLAIPQYSSVMFASNDSNPFVTDLC